MRRNKNPRELSSDQRLLIEEIVSLVFAMAQRLEQHANARAAEFGLTMSQAKVLTEIEPGEAVPMGALATRLNYDASNLTGLVDKLEARGILERRPDPNDRRVKGLVITEEGLRLKEDFRRRLVDHSESFGALSDTQLGDLRRLLQLALGNE